MNIKRLTDINSEEFQIAFEIYESSFPECERRNLEHLKEALCDELYFFEVIQNEDEAVVGILLSWKTEKFIYIEHFAILQKMRGQKIGSKVLEYLKSKTNVPVILEIEPPEDEITIKRKLFYERSGFEMSGYEYIHPAFEEKNTPHVLKIVTSPKIGDALYQEYYSFFVNCVMKYADKACQNALKSTEHKN